MELSTLVNGAKVTSTDSATTNGQMRNNSLGTLVLTSLRDMVKWSGMTTEGIEEATKMIRSKATESTLITMEA